MSADDAVEAAKAEFDRARSDWERAQKLIKNDDITRQQYDQFRTRNESAQATLSQVQQQQRMVKEGPQGRGNRRTERDGGTCARQPEVGAGERARTEAPRAGSGGAAGGDRACESPDRADRFATRRHDSGVAGRWRSAGEVGRSGRGACARHRGPDGRRCRSSLAAGIYQRTRFGTRETRNASQHQIGLLPGEDLSRAASPLSPPRPSSRPSRSRRPRSA